MFYDPSLTGGGEALLGYILYAANGQITEVPFMYSTVESRKFSIQSSLMERDIILPTERIRTSRLDLPFSSGLQIRLRDGRTMTVKTAEPVINGNVAAATGGSGQVAWLIILEGGANG